MSYIITARTATAVLIYAAIGDLGELLDAAYDSGALGVTVVVRP